MHLKGRLRNGCHFVSAYMCYELRRPFKKQNTNSHLAQPAVGVVQEDRERVYQFTRLMKHPSLVCNVGLRVRFNVWFQLRLVIDILLTGIPHTIIHCNSYCIYNETKKYSSKISFFAFGIAGKTFSWKDSSPRQYGFSYQGADAFNMESLVVL